MKYILVLTCSMLTGCSTTLPFAIDADNAWFLEREVDGNAPVFCMANIENKKASPICYEAKKVSK